VSLVSTSGSDRIVDRTLDYNPGSEIVFNDKYIEDVQHIYTDTNIKMTIKNNLGNHVLKLRSRQFNVNLLL